MIKVAVCDIHDLNLDEAINHVSTKRCEKINKYRFITDKKLSCGAELLLQKLLNDEEIFNPIYKEDKYDKPYIANYDIQYNLSHSNQMLACVISDKTVGVDIEYIDKNIDLSIAKHYFYNNEYDNIINSENPSDEFFKYWVLKESYMKYTGLGFQLQLNDFNINILNQNEIKLEIKNRDNITKKLETLTNNDLSIDTPQLSLFNLDDYKLAVTSYEKVNKYVEYDVDEL